MHACLAAHLVCGYMQVAMRHDVGQRLSVVGGYVWRRGGIHIHGGTKRGYWMEGTGMTRVCMHVGREGGNEGG